MARKKKTTWKDQASNISGLIIALAGAVGALTLVIEVPDWAVKAAIIAGTFATAFIGWLQGKDGDGKSKVDQFGRVR